MKEFFIYYLRGIDPRRINAKTTENQRR